MDHLQAQQGLTEAYLLAAVLRFYGAGFKKDDSAIRGLAVSDRMVQRATEVLSSGTDAMLKDNLWVYVSKSLTQGGSRSFLGSFMLVFILSLAIWEMLSTRLLAACKVCMETYGTTSWGPARTFNDVCGVCYLKSWSPQDPCCTSPEWRPTSCSDQRVCWAFAMLFYLTPVGQELAALLRRFNLPHGPLDVTFLFCELRKYYGAKASKFRSSLKKHAPSIRASVQGMTVVPTWVQDADFHMIFLTKLRDDADEQGEPDG